MKKKTFFIVLAICLMFTINVAYAEVLQFPVWENTEVTNLGTFGDGSTMVFGMNDLGQVVGVATIDSANIKSHPFLWENGQLRDMADVAGEFSWFSDINNKGQIVGTDRNSQVFLLENGQMTNLGNLGTLIADPDAINDNGQIVGEAKVSVGEGKTEYHAFLWDNGQVLDLGTLGGNYSHATDINNRGQIVGYSYMPDGQRHAFLWENGQMSDLGTLGGSSSIANAINDKGQIIGNATMLNGKSIAFLRDNGETTVLDVPGSSSTRASDINNLGQIIGTSNYNGNRVVLWENGQMRDLGSESGEYDILHEINDQGQITYDIMKIRTGNTTANSFLIKLLP